MSWTARARERSRTLPLSCFAPVMATGIVSRALDATGVHRLAGVFLVVAGAGYAALLAGTLIKATCHPDRIREDLRNPARLFGAFTFTAASDVLATGLSTARLRLLANALLLAAALAWAACVAAVVRAVRHHRRTALQHADGTWFLATVGLQSLALALTATHHSQTATTIALALWIAGTALYVTTLCAVVQRLRRRPPQPHDLTPTYWISMGAAAICLLTGSHLPVHSRLLDTVLATLWIWATLLIPPLLAVGAWRHLRHRIPLTYDPALWCIVFPAGMYATATAHLSTTTAGVFLPIGNGPAYCAVATWVGVSALLAAARA